MKIYKRDKDRNLNKIKEDIDTTKRILREDIYEVLKDSNDKKFTRENAEKDLRKFLKELTGIDKYIELHGSLDAVVERIASDIDSYGFKWEEK